MIINAADIGDNEIIQVDICIVGTGPAGLTLASELSNLPIKVCLLESGDSLFKEDTQSLYAGEVDSHHYPHDELLIGRCRQLGGSSNFWEIQVDENAASQGILHVRHVIPDEIDFQSREEIPYSGWPFQRSEEHTSELQSHSDLVCRLLLEKKKDFSDKKFFVSKSLHSSELVDKIVLNERHAGDLRWKEQIEKI